MVKSYLNSYANVYVINVYGNGRYIWLVLVLLKKQR